MSGVAQQERPSQPVSIAWASLGPNNENRPGIIAVRSGTIGMRLNDQYEPQQFDASANRRLDVSVIVYGAGIHSPSWSVTTHSGILLDLHDSDAINTLARSADGVLRTLGEREGMSMTLTRFKETNELVNGYLDAYSTPTPGLRETQQTAEQKIALAMDFLTRRLHVGIEQLQGLGVDSFGSHLLSIFDLPASFTLEDLAMRVVQPAVPELEDLDVEVR